MTTTAEPPLGSPYPAAGPFPTNAVESDEKIVVPYRRFTNEALLGNLVLAIFGILFLLPLLWLILSAFDTQASWSIELPTITLSNFADVTSSSDLQSLYNSFYLSVVAT